jgi:hypothetical protein
MQQLSAPAPNASADKDVAGVGWLRQLDASADGAVCGGGLTGPVQAASTGRLCRWAVIVMTGPGERRPRQVRGQSAATGCLRRWGSGDGTGAAMSSAG